MSPLDLTERFLIAGRRYALLADAAQEAEYLHAETGHVHEVTALVTEPEYFVAGDVVYTSRGAP